MTRRQKVTLALWVAAGVPLAVGAVAGLALSFGNVVEVVRPIVGNDLAPVFPLVWDVVLAGAALAYLATAYGGRPRVMWRVISLSGAVGTVVVNATAAHDTASLVIHVSGPAAWAVLVEAGAAQLRADYRTKNQDVLGQAIPVRLWIWSPRESARTWLRMARRLDGEQKSARLEAGVHAAAVEALRLAVPGRAGRRARRIIVRQLRAGSLSPEAVLRSVGWLDPGQDTGPGQQVLRAALAGALGHDQDTGEMEARAAGAKALPGETDQQHVHATTPGPSSPAVPVQVQVVPGCSQPGTGGLPAAGTASTGPPPVPQPVPQPPVAAAARRPVRVSEPVRGTGPVGGTAPGGRSVEVLLPQVRDAIHCGVLGAAPSAEAIRRYLRCAPKTARTLRDEFAG